MNYKKSLRLDHYLMQQYPYETRQRIQELIKNGSVLVDGVAVTKSGTKVTSDTIIAVDFNILPYVSRAGVKLAHALDHFGIEVQGLIILDAGLSTGGFADCLLQRGATKIFGVDVGHGQVNEHIKHDPRLIVMEKTNLKEVKNIPDIIDMVTLDLSFISVLKVIDVVYRLLKAGGELIVLIKPQFESGIEHRGKKGVITDNKVHQKIVEGVTQGIVDHGFACRGVIESPILGGSGNKEFLGYFVKKYSV